MQEELKKTTITMVEQSKVLNKPGAEKQTKRELFDALRQELEAPVLEKASKSVWDLILDDNGLGKEISETVERVFCRLSGQEPPLFPSSSDTQQQEKDQEENPHSVSRKRTFNEMNDNTDRINNGSEDVPATSEDRNPVPSSSTKT